MATEVILQPGDYFFGAEDIQIKAFLGSCIAITLWHPQHKLGGMCHFMLPSRGTMASTLDGRYGDEAVALLQQAIARYPAPLREYEAKLFGGGNMFGEPQYLQSDRNVAAKNIQAAWQLTCALGVDIKAHHLGHSGHRSLIFELHSGNVWLRHHRLPHQREPRK